MSGKALSSFSSVLGSWISGCANSAASLRGDLYRPPKAAKTSRWDLRRASVSPVLERSRTNSFEDGERP